MAKTDSYLQFPLCLLAYGKDIPTRMAAIFAFGARTIGRRFIEKQGEDFIVDGFIAGIVPPELERVYDDSPSQREIVIGLHKLKFEPNDELFESMVKGLESADSFCAKMKRRYGKSPLVRIKADYAVEVLRGTGMSYRTFSTLCGLFSVIGNKHYPMRITRDRIRARAMGYKSANMLFSKDGKLTESGQKLLAEREDGAPPLTTDQVRYTLDILEENGHFARVQANKSQIYFSDRMTREGIYYWLYDWKTQRPNIVKFNRWQDRQLQYAIKQGRAAETDFERERLKSNIDALSLASCVPVKLPTALPTSFPVVTPHLSPL